MTHDRLLTHEFQASFGQKQPTYTDLIKEALLEKSAEIKESVATFSPAMDKSPALKGKQSKLPDNIQAAILRKKLKSSKEKNAMIDNELLNYKAQLAMAHRQENLEKSAEGDVDPGWSDAQGGMMRAVRRGDSGINQWIAKPELVGERVTKATGYGLAGAGLGALGGAAAGALARKGLGLPAGPAAVLGGSLGAALAGSTGHGIGILKADKEYLGKKGIKPKLLGLGGATFSPEAAKKYLPKQASVQHEAFFDELSAIQKEAVVGALGGALRGGASAIRQGGKQFFGGQGTAKGIGQSIKGATQKGWQTGAKQQRQAGKMISSGQQARPAAQRVIGSHRRNLAAGGAAAAAGTGLMGYGAYKAVT